ncbi:MAG: GNAT family N-acetyltransferase [Ilumatobacteraceae bacterium]
MTAETSVRPVDESSASECVSIDDSLRQGMVDRRGGEAWLAEHPRLGDLEQWWGDSFVACVDEVVVGFLVGRVDEDPRGRIFVVDRVFVVDGARGLGCGDDLLEVALSHAIARGCAYLEGTALPGGRDTKNLYERAGVTARSITVSQRLSDRSSSEHVSR